MNRFILVVALTWIPSLAMSAEPAMTEARVASKQPIWVGQRVQIYVDLLSETYFAGAPSFLLPQVSEAILLKVEDRPILGQKTIDETLYTVQTHELAFFPQRAGRLEIPPIQITFEAAGKPGEPPVSRTVVTEALQVEVKAPPGAAGLSLLVSTTRFEVEETWFPDSDTLKVGDSLKRKFVLTADGIPGMALPSIPLQDDDALSVYPTDIAIQDRTQRGEFTGSRTQIENYVCQSEGTVEFPPIALTWFDTKDGRLRKIVLPARTIQIDPGAAATDDAGENSVVATRPFSWKRAAGVTALLLGFCVACARFGPGMQRRYESWREVRHQSEPATFHRLQQAITKGNATEVYDAAIKWAVAIEPDSTLTPAERMDAWTGSSELRLAVDQLQAAVVGRQNRWDGVLLARELKRYRRALLLEKSSSGEWWRGRRLAELNP